MLGKWMFENTLAMATVQVSWYDKRMNTSVDLSIRSTETMRQHTSVWGCVWFSLQNIVYHKFNAVRLNDNPIALNLKHWIFGSNVKCTWQWQCTIDTLRFMWMLYDTRTLQLHTFVYIHKLYVMRNIIGQCIWLSKYIPNFIRIAFVSFSCMHFATMVDA